MNAPVFGVDAFAEKPYTGNPATGSAHCALGPYWAERLGKPVLTAVQASKRGGLLLVRPKDGRVFVAGRAFTAWRGELTLP